MDYVIPDPIKDRSSSRRKGECEKIVVFGASIEAVNGEYHFAGRGFCEFNEQNDAPVYDMKGTWEGRDAIFSIVFRGLRCWYICILQRSCYFYCSNPVAIGLETSPPPRLWWPVDSEKSLNIMLPPNLLCDGATMLDWRQTPLTNFADFKIEVTRTVATILQVF
jgi:hypothetical protein